MGYTSDYAQKMLGDKPKVASGGKAQSLAPIKHDKKKRLEKMKMSPNNPNY